MYLTGDDTLRSQTGLMQCAPALLAAVCRAKQQQTGIEAMQISWQGHAVLPGSQSVPYQPALRKK